jgi:hypothetical protein
MSKVFVGKDVMTQQRRFVCRQIEQASALPVREYGAAGHGRFFGESVAV